MGQHPLPKSTQGHEKASADSTPQRERERFQEHIQRHHLRNTRKRQLILEAFLESQGHITAEELYQKVRTRDASIGLATVYRTLNLLCEARLAEARNFGDGQTRYEIAREFEHHDHLICTRCGSIVEFTNCNIERLQEKVAREHGFTIYTHKLEIYGLCAHCQKAL